jgi:hypothetical protein
MHQPFVAAAISRQDGSAGDGIHLLWTAPPSAGYSVKGYDIQRRTALTQREQICYTLTSDELLRLHRDLRLETSLVSLAVRRAECPTFPPKPPDEPFQEPTPEHCVDFRTFPPKVGRNPRTDRGVSFRLQNPAGVPANRTEVKKIVNFTGLDCGLRMEIALPVRASVVELTMVHFSRPARAEAFNADGTSASAAVMTAASGQAETLRLSGANINRLIVNAPADETLLLMICYQPAAQERAQELAQESGRPSSFAIPESDLHPATSAGSVSSLAIAAIGQPICLAYDIDLRGAHHFVQVIAGAPGILAIALRDGKAVDTRMVTSGSGLQVAIFQNRAVDRVLLYTSRPLSSLTICVDILPDPRKEEAEWSGVTFIAKNIQMPLRSVNGALATPAAEDGLASSRLLAGESFDAPAFREVADAMNEAAAEAAVASPVWFTTLTRERTEDQFIEVRAWPYGFALLAEAPWRRMLGFGYLDKGGGLTPGAAYDYRITGYFRRRDVEERLYGFHTIPLGTTLPASFHLGDLLLNTLRPARVEMFPAVASTALRSAGRKGIALEPAGFFGAQSLLITFSSPVMRIVLEFEPAAMHSLSYEAKTSDYLFGLSGATFSGGVPAGTRVTLDFPEPVDTLALKGRAFLYGIRVVTSPAGADPDEIIAQSVVVPGVRYEPTAPPAAPPFLGTMNLQEPVVAGDPAVTTQNPPDLLGFRLLWIPPPAAGSSWPIPWPPDVSLFPPFDVVGFHLERRRVDVATPFEEIDAQKPHTLFFGNRGSRADTPQLFQGIDLLRVFPDSAKIEPPISIFMDVDDVLVKMETGGPPPGSLHQYRIFSVDAIGRRSAAATLGSIVRLEKRIPPPPPVGPQTPPPAGATVPSGVRARALQASDPELTAADRALLGSHANAVVLEWGWTAEERKRDPYARNFRVYWQPVPPDKVIGSLTGVAAPVAGRWEMSASLNQAIAADAMAGRYIRAGNYPFKVASHTAGQMITIRVERSVLDAGAVPLASDFEFHPVRRGDELRPAAWPERTAIVPITASESYQFVFNDRLTIDAAHPRVRVWVGVSAADDQSYRPDEIPAARPNGGQPGNESSIAAVSVEARYIGRPVFTVPPPLANVPEQVADETPAELVPVRLDLGALLPAVSIPASHRVALERLGADALVSLISARNDNAIGVALPDGSSTSYVLANPADQAAFLAQIRSRTPARVEGRFLMDLLLRFPAQLERLWQPALPAPVAFAAVADTLPNKAERYLHRIRLVDAAGHVSEGAAILPQFVRVPSLRSPAAPEIAMDNSESDVLAITARMRDAFDLKWLLLFSLGVDATTPADAQILEKPQLLRQPNRRDLYPNDGVRLRLRDGTLLAPLAVDVGTGTLETPDRVLNLTLTPGFEKRISIWAVAMTRDGVTSRFAGPRTAFTGPSPLVPPTLSVTTAAGEDLATWTALAVPAEVAVERSLDGGANWERVSPWLPETISPRSFAVPISGTGSRRYRLALRGSRGRSVTGTEVIVS